MKVEREQDRRIAKGYFGWTDIRGDRGDNPSGQRRYIPDYSTDAAAFKALLEKLLERGWWVTFRCDEVTLYSDANKWIEVRGKPGEALVEAACKILEAGK